jgi:signal transduction histidine kinase
VAKVTSSFEKKIKMLEKKIERLQRDAKNTQESLQKKLKNTKIFLNMVIHDMRNPTTSIEFALKEVLSMILKAKEKTQH